MRIGVGQIWQLTKLGRQPQAELVRFKRCGNIKRPFSQASEERKPSLLLRYPANNLADTLQKFLRSCRPLLSKEEMQQTAEMADQFLSGEGEALQSLLQKEAASSSNWLAERWLKTAYLQCRDPVTIYSSPGMTLPLTSFRNDRDYLMHCAKLIMGLVKYKDLIDRGEIPLSRMGNRILDNSQFKRVFGTCRVPGLQEDTMRYHPNSKHVVIIHHASFYKLPVYDANNVPIIAERLAAQLKGIRDCAEEEGVPYGLLTHQSRDDWAECYRELLKSPQNAACLQEIQKSLFTVSLDNPVSATTEEVYGKLAKQLVHGGGSSLNSANRWMDKTIQLIVNPGGMAGFCYEHSPAEGQPIAQMAEYLTKILSEEGQEFVSGSDCVAPFTKLEFETPSHSMELKLERAETNFSRLIDDLQMTVVCFKDYGKEFLKQHRFRPDSFIQTAIQYAFYRLHRVPAAQYETAHLRIYDGGRTETIRSCTLESLQFAQAMLNEEADNEERLELLKKAVDAHSQYMQMALEGNGVDRHLLGLKLMAIENNRPVPAFYQSPGVVKSAHFRLSTSQVASKDPVFMCYGPLTLDGYSCCYNPRENDMFFALGAWYSHPETCAQRYAESLKTALLDMQTLVLGVAEQTLNSKL